MRSRSRISGRSRSACPRPSDCGADPAAAGSALAIGLRRSDEDISLRTVRCGRARPPGLPGSLGGVTVPGGGGNDALQPQLLVMGMESVSGLANFSMGPRSALPRNPIDNTVGSQGNLGNYRDFVVEHRAAFMAALSLANLAKLGTLGSSARDARARAFARFVQGTALGNIALAYDSGIVITEGNVNAAIIPLASHDSVMRAAIGYLDSAIAIARVAPTGSDGFPIPNTWINGVTLSTSLFIQLANSYQARFRAGLARTPAERANPAVV